MNVISVRLALLIAACALLWLLEMTTRSTPAPIGRYEYWLMFLFAAGLIHAFFNDVLAFCGVGGIREYDIRYDGPEGSRVPLPARLLLGYPVPILVIYCIMRLYKPA